MATLVFTWRATSMTTWPYSMTMVTSTATSRSVDVRLDALVAAPAADADALAYALHGAGHVAAEVGDALHLRAARPATFSTTSSSISIRPFTCAASWLRRWRVRAGDP